MDVTAFFKLSYGLYLLNTCYNNKQNGCVINTACQVTAEPARISVAVNKNNLTYELIEKSGYFTVTPFTQDATMDIIGNFGFKSGKDIDKFAKPMPTAFDMNGIKYVAENVAAVFSCKLTGTLDVGTHVILIGDVQYAEKLSDEPVMTYDYYHKVKKGKTPPKAPSYKPQEDQAEDAGKAADTIPSGDKAQSVKKKWRCSVCGYIHEGEELPDDFECPICGQPASVFELLDSI